MADEAATRGPDHEIALSVALKDTTVELERTITLANQLTSPKSPGQAALANALQALGAAHTLLQDELSEDLAHG